jgi:tetratricopeptide (TPR) repeat protein
MPGAGRSASLIIRSVGRPELGEALESAGAQSFPNLEIVVVDATGGRHPPVPASVGAHPVRFVAGSARRRRPVAANAGLDAATGDYVGFLDDDDTLLPAHVAALAGALDAESGIGLAFSIAREVRPNGETHRIGHARLSRLMLLESCFFPPCAALFRRSLVAHCRFDETLDAAEDWDFWLQLSRHAAFGFVPQETAIYRADRGRSSMSTGAAEGDHWRGAVLAKWADERAALTARLNAAYDAALAHGARGDHAAAAKAAGQVLALHPFHAGALNLRGTARALGGDMAGARADFAAAAEAEPTDAVSLFNLAQAESALRHVDEAETLYRRVLALEPLHAHARAQLEQLQRKTHARQPR